MDTVVLKFGGSSLANNERLMMVANKIIEKAMKHKVVVVVSAQGKTTDNLLKQAKELEEITKSQNINKRELDMLLSTGEQVSASKLAILLNLIGHKSISLNGYQAQIYTNNNYQNASIIKIDTERIKKELKENIVIITGFQGIDENNNITTLGRGGSDTTAVALSAELNASRCYIYSDVDGIYTADPRKIPHADK
ncbi:MAG: aspartate kinase, partial [Clostridia bacterium]